MLFFNRPRTWLLTTFIVLLSACTTAPVVIDSRVQTNSKSALDKPYVILISLDAFRWDYVDRFKPPHLSRFINEGVKSESLIPSYPSKTFPNHYTIATGLYPDKHGIISNSFYDPELNLEYSKKAVGSSEDGRFYGGTPIWVQAARSGLVTASYFFLGSEAEVQGIRPTYYKKFNMTTKKEVRVNKVLEWLNLPANERPHMITMYFPDMDNTGHRYGPNNDEKLKASLFELDQHLGNLFDGVKQTNLAVNIIIVSDHGMSDVAVDNYLSVDSLYNDELYRAYNNGSMINIYPYDNQRTDEIFALLKAREKNNHFKVYRTKDAPRFEYIPHNKNWGAMQIIPDDGYYFNSDWLIGRRIKSGEAVFGEHGFDSNDKNMHGIFFANGPAFKKGFVAPSVKNIHIYPLMCTILDLDIPDNIDGKLAPIQSVLSNN